MDLVDAPHHDGSAAYVSDLAPRLGDEVTLLLRVPRASGVTRALLRTFIDGEQELRATVVDREDDDEVWLRATLPVANPVVNYRWLLDGVPGGYQWLNGEGIFRRDVTDAADFRISTFAPPPAWAADAVMYQVFPDRFAKSVDREAPEWAIAQEWSDPVVGDGPETPVQWYGGDLDGIVLHLDHIAATGANTLYLTPMFPGRSNHRYDASTFDAVDPLLGGDEAFTRLADAVHARGMRLIGDLTTNHSGSGHEWFQRAVGDASSPEASYYTFLEHPHRYVAWWDLPHLPKFDHSSQALRDALYEGPASAVARWLGPGGLDGWRIDVANMTGRLGAVDLSLDVARTLRATMAETDPEALLLAEHSYDAARDLSGDGWHGIMDYAGFTRPVWQWLRPAAPVRLEAGFFAPTPTIGGATMVATMRAFAAQVPWRSRATAMNLVGSHDTMRIRTLLGGDEGLIDVAFGLLAAMPGIPTLWAGDELGLEGVNGEDGRRPMPWDDEASWDRRRLDGIRDLLAARAASEALRHGGLRWIAASDDAVTFLREAPGESVLVHAARADHPPVTLPARIVGPRPVPLAGSPELSPDAEGSAELPARGPSFGLWQVG